MVDNDSNPIAPPAPGVPASVEDLAALDVVVSRAIPSIAVVGSGPSGCYVAQFLTKHWPTAEVSVFESLPTPYGLIRYGVAPDHQGAKGVIKQFDRLFTNGRVQFIGNVTVGRHVTFEGLAAAYDVVVLATGLPIDRELDIPHARDTRVVGAGRMLRTLNGHPHQMLTTDVAGVPALGRRLAIVGMGNVAIDVVRLLCKSDSELVGSDIDDRLRKHVLPEPPTRIDVVGRSTAAHAKCDVAMLRELISLPSLDVAVTGLDPSEQSGIAEALQGYPEVARSVSRGVDASAPIQLNLHFGVVPVSIDSRGGQSNISAVSHDGSRRLEIEADTVITAIGFTHGSADDPACPTNAWSDTHVYRVGWLSRGARGAIPENRKQARQVADRIINDVAQGAIQPRRPGFRLIEPLIADRLVSFAGWKRIDSFEIQSAPPNRCRRKITDVEKMLVVAASPDHKFLDENNRRVAGASRTRKASA